MPCSIFGRLHLRYTSVRALSPIRKGARDDVDRAVRKRHAHAEFAKLAERLCGRRFAAGTISNLVATLDTALQAFASRRLDDVTIPHLMLDARYEKVHDVGAVPTRAVQIAVGIDTAGHRHVLAVEAADRESENSWETFLIGLKERCLTGVQYVVSDISRG